VAVSVLPQRTRPARETPPARRTDAQTDEIDGSVTAAPETDHTLTRAGALSVEPPPIARTRQRRVRPLGLVAADERPATRGDRLLGFDRLALGVADLAAVAEQIVAPAAPTATPVHPLAPQRMQEDEQLDALIERLVDDLELEYVRLYGTGELGR
jgi:hypothetical protein